MRIVAVVAATLLVGLSLPATAQCMGKYPSEICVYDDGVWTPAGYLRFPKKLAGPSKYPNATSAGPSNSQAATNEPAAGETGVLKPSAETGNAWVLTPQNGGATCGQGTDCD